MKGPRPPDPSRARYLNKEVSGIDYKRGRFLPMKKSSIPGPKKPGGSSATRKTCIAPTSAGHRPGYRQGPCTPGMEPASGKPIQINGVSYEVIGVLEPRKRASSSRINPRTKP